MEQIIITKRKIKNKFVYNKLFVGYDKGFFGSRITKFEYLRSKEQNKAIYIDAVKVLNIVERITYNN